MQCMEVKLCTHVYFSVSMTTINKKWPRALLPITTSSLLKLAHHAMHGGETLYACVFKCSHDDYQQKIPSGTFPYNYFFTSQTCTPSRAYRAAEGGERACNARSPLVDGEATRRRVQVCQSVITLPSRFQCILELARARVSRALAKRRAQQLGSDGIVVVRAPRSA